jgi:hypothetical protein
MDASVTRGALMQNVKLSIVIPVYNEINTILELVRQVQDEKTSERDYHR